LYWKEFCRRWLNETLERLKIMATRIRRIISAAGQPWLTEQGINLSLYPIDSVLRQALSPNEDEFRSGCSMLRSMSYAGRVEAGVFLLGLLRLHPDDYARLTLIADALWSFPTAATVDALAAELRRVKGSSSTRGYLRRIIKTLELFPAHLAKETIHELAFDPQVGARFRQHLRAMVDRDFDR
jgi:hypothetical protein